MEGRRPIFGSSVARKQLREAFASVRRKHPFDIAAIVLIPDHFHLVVTLPVNDFDYSTRLRLIKRQFTQRHLSAGGRESNVSSSRRRSGERGIWQPRFWEHACRDESDVERCVDYVHWNPVKHGLAESPIEYPYSSFHRHVEEGTYPKDWIASSDCRQLECRNEKVMGSF